MVNSHSLRINKRTIDFNKKLTDQTKTFLIENCALVGGQSFVAVGDETCKDWVCIGAEIENGVGVYPGWSLAEENQFSEKVQYAHAIWISLQKEKQIELKKVIAA